MLGRDEARYQSSPLGDEKAMQTNLRYLGPEEAFQILQSQLRRHKIKVSFRVEISGRNKTGKGRSRLKCLDEVELRRHVQARHLFLNSLRQELFSIEEENRFLLVMHLTLTGSSEAFRMYSAKALQPIDERFSDYQVRYVDTLQWFGVSLTTLEDCELRSVKDKVCVPVFGEPQSTGRWTGKTAMAATSGVLSGVWCRMPSGVEDKLNECWMSRNTLETSDESKEFTAIIQLNDEEYLFDAKTMLAHLVVQRSGTEQLQEATPHLMNKWEGQERPATVSGSGCPDNLTSASSSVSECFSQSTEEMTSPHFVLDTVVAASKGAAQPNAVVKSRSSCVSKRTLRRFSRTDSILSSRYQKLNCELDISKTLKFTRVEVHQPQSSDSTSFGPRRVNVSIFNPLRGRRDTGVAQTSSKCSVDLSLDCPHSKEMDRSSDWAIRCHSRALEDVSIRSRARLHGFLWGGEASTTDFCDEQPVICCDEQPVTCWDKQPVI